MNDEPRFLRVRNWERYQDSNLAAKYVASGGALPWLKQMTKRLDDVEYTQLHPLSRYIWSECIGLAAHFGPNRLPYDARWLQERMHASYLGAQFESCLEELVNAGFLQPFTQSGTGVGTESGTSKSSGLRERKKANAFLLAKEKSREVPGEEPLEEPATAESPSESPPKRPRDELWDALTSELGSEPATRTERGSWNKALKDLREAGATPQDVHQRSAVYRHRWPEVSLTPTALAKHWGSLDSSEGAPAKDRLAAHFEALKERGVT